MNATDEMLLFSSTQNYFFGFVLIYPKNNYGSSD